MAFAHPTRSCATPFFLATLTLSCLAACGGRSGLSADEEAGGGGGAATTGGPGGGTSTGTTTTTSPPSACPSLFQSSIEIVPTPGPAHRFSLEYRFDTDEAIVSYVDTPEGVAGRLRGSGAPLFVKWPPQLPGFDPLIEDVVDFATGPGFGGPVTHVLHSDGQGELLFALYPEPASFSTPFSSGDGPILFITAIEDRYFGAQTYDAPSYQVLDVNSYEPGGLPQSEEPLVCSTTPILGAAVPSGSGFLAAFTAPDDLEPCDVQSPSPSTLLTLARYDSTGGGPSLARIEGAVLGFGEPFVHVAMAPAPSGAWLVYQTDGSLSESQPPVVAVRMDEAAGLLAGGDTTAVTPGGYLPPAVAVAALGERLAVAHVDAIDPSAPVIIVQIVEPDGALGAAIAFPTNEAWYYGDLELLPSPAGDSLLVGWRTYVNDERVALTRLDCFVGE